MRPLFNLRQNSHKCIFCCHDLDLDLMTLMLITQGQYWAGRTPPSNNPLPPNTATVVIANAERCALDGTAVAAVLIDQ